MSLFSRSFKHKETYCSNFSPLFILFMVFKFLCFSIIILPQRVCLSFFLMCAHVRATCLQGFFLRLFIFVFCIIFKGFSPHVSSLPQLMTPISLILPMSFPSFLIILHPNWLMWGYLFNPASVWPRFHLVYLLSLYPPPNYVTPLWHWDPWCPFWLCFLYFFFFARGSKQGCSACKRTFEIKGCLGGFWKFLLMFCPKAFFFDSLFFPFQGFQS